MSPTQPNWQNSSWLPYVQVPPLHEPGASNTVRCELSEHFFAPGLLHVTPWQGSPTQAPLAQPLAQACVALA
jgi:hypothetical protein